MKRVVYRSRESEPMSDAQVADLLSQARRKNDVQNITGMLIRHDGCFLQAIEGEVTVIDTLYHKIRHDPRHTDVETLADEPISERVFHKWTMGFRNMSAGEIRNIARLAELSADDPLLVRISAPEADALLSEAAVSLA